MSDIVIDKLVRSRRRTIGLEITREAKLVVRAPYFVKQKDIDRLIMNKRKWILKKQEINQQRKSEYSGKRFVEGENFYYLGQAYGFRLIDEDDIRLTEYLEFPRQLLPQAREILIQWYKTRADEKIKERVELYSKITGLPYKNLKISSARKRYGSCSSKGKLNFSWKLIMAPLEIIDYVVVHELVHIAEMNHSRRFWQKVAEIRPDYKMHRFWLKHNFTEKEAWN